MPKLISIRDRAGWAIPGFKAGAHTLRLSHELKDWDVHVRPTKVFLVKGNQVEELPRDDLRLSWQAMAGESAADAINGCQNWSSVAEKPATEAKGVKK